MQQYQSMYDLRRDKDLKNYGSEYDNPLNAKLLPSQVSKSREQVNSVTRFGLQANARSSKKVNKLNQLLDEWNETGRYDSGNLL